MQMRYTIKKYHNGLYYVWKGLTLLIFGYVLEAHRRD